ncbi:MAG: sugar phosphate isomerase/epimerase [Clostridia bacterium]|nr:sugar phosphate isomerase/epimerase [Clostridia bacterium]
MRIGAQLYTVREHCKTLDDFALTLRKVADIGYRTVQVSGTCAFEPAWLKEQLDKNGLQCVLTHTAAARLMEDAAQVAADHEVFGCHHVGLGSYPFRNEGTPESFFNEYGPVARTLRENGKYFMYHNHDGEFQKVNGKLIMDHIAEMFPAEDLGFTVDTFWVQAGGADPALWIEKLSDRVPCIHLKDFAYGRKMAPVGEGNINFDRVFKKAEAAGTRYMLVEQDDCNGEDPFVCLKRSFDYLSSQGFK